MQSKILNLFALFLLGYLFSACTTMGRNPGGANCQETPQSTDGLTSENRLDYNSSAYAQKVPLGVKKFSSPTSLDSLLAARPITVADVWPTSDTLQSISPPPKTAVQLKPEPAKGIYRIQLMAVADFETAQKEKSNYSKLLGVPVQVLFDAPFYKLRTGRFPTKQQARENLLDIKEMGLQGFIVKE